MRYHYTRDTLFIRGDFRAASTGVAGGISNVKTVFNRTVPHDFHCDEPEEYINGIAGDQGYTDGGLFGLLTAVGMKSLCVLSCGYITVFITAGVSNPNPGVSRIPGRPGTINIIVHSARKFSDAALLETIKTATEAKTAALYGMGYNFTGTTTDAVIVAFDRDTAAEETVKYAGALTDTGRRITECVGLGVQEAILRHESKVSRSKPSFFIFSTIDGPHWSEWSPKSCPYYPCHFSGQACDFCYCPFYPCHDEELGGWVDSSEGKKVWACTDCLLLHHKKTASYLKKNPDAGKDDLKRYAEANDLNITGR